MKKRLMPELRFPEFNGEWEEKELGKLTTDLSYGMNASAKQFDGENKYIRITDIDESNNSYIEEGKVSPDDKLEGKFLLQESDILFARTGASVGKTYYYKASDGKMYFAGFLIRARIKMQYDYRYIFYNTLTNRYDNWVKTMSARSGQPGINAVEYSSYLINIPSIEEQSKIAKCFTLIDNKIEKQEEKVINLEEYKKGMIHKIFSQEIRFKDENGEDYPEWEEKKLGEVAKVKTGSTPPTNDLSNYGDKYLFVSPGDLGSRKYIIDTEKKLSEKGFKKSRRFVKDSILFTCIGSTIGKIGLAKVDLTSNQQLNAILPNSNYSSEYLYYILSYLAPRIKSLAANQAVPIINKTDFEQKLILIPCLKEQEKIANFLSSIDLKIEKEKEKLDYLRELKKGLIQKMFI